MERVDISRIATLQASQKQKRQSTHPWHIILMIENDSICKSLGDILTSSIATSSGSLCFGKYGS